MKPDTKGESVEAVSIRNIQLVKTGGRHICAQTAKYCSVELLGADARSASSAMGGGSRR